MEELLKKAEKEIQDKFDAKKAELLEIENKIKKAEEIIIEERQKKYVVEGEIIFIQGEHNAIQNLKK